MYPEGKEGCENGRVKWVKRTIYISQFFLKQVVFYLGWCSGGAMERPILKFPFIHHQMQYLL